MPEVNKAKKEILKPLILDGKLLVIGKNKDRRYKLGAG